MKWSWNVGRIAGIDLKIHLTFVFLLIWTGFTTLSSGGDMAAMVGDILLILALFLCVVLHEYGHALTARLFGIHTQDITLLPIGGVARLESMPEDPKEELAVAAAGPAVNLVIGAALLVSLLLSGSFASPMDISALTGNFWVRLMTMNFSLVAFNLIPAFPMDGGRVLRGILGLRMDRVKATKIAANIGRGIAVVMGLVGFFINPWLVLIALFVWSGAGAEAQSVEVKAGLKGLTVRDALVTQFYQVEANQSLVNVFQLSMQTGQQNIPVVSNGNLLGIIRRQDLLSAMERLGERAPAYAAIGVEPEGLDPEMSLADVLPKFSTCRVQPVVEDGALIGLVTPESIQQRMWLNRKMNSSPTPPPNEKTDTI
jgi:Zn-dependent protease